MKVPLRARCRLLSSLLFTSAILAAAVAPAEATGITNCVPIPPGLIAWWAAEGNALDQAGTNNGVLRGGASFASGVVAQAFSFSGSGQSVQIPYTPSLIRSNYSIEAWVKPLTQVADAIDQDVIFGQFYGCQLVARRGTSGVRIAFQFGISHVTFPAVVSTIEVPIGQFSHLVGTWDGTVLRLYINGVLNAQRTPGYLPVDPGCPFVIGGFDNPTADSCGYVGQFFNGLIDEVSYYGRALSAAEIAAIHEAGSAGKCPPSIPQCVLPPVGLVAWWAAEGSALDQTGTNNGVLRGEFSFTAGEVGQAFRFNGTNADVRVPGSPSLNVGLADGFTIEAWINPAEIDRWHPVVEWNDGSFGVNFSVSDPSSAGPGSLWINVKDTGYHDRVFSTAAGLITSNAWQHVAVTYLKSNGSTVLYINGMPQAQKTLGVFTPRTIGNLYIGLRPYDGGAGARFAGAMDEICLYNRSLTAEEVRAIYLAGSGGKCLAPVNHPPVALCANLNVPADTNCVAEASIDNGSFDPDGGLIAITQSPPGPYPLGTNLVTLTVTDSTGASNSCSAVVTVRDTVAPVLICPAGKVVEFQDEGGAVVTFSPSATDICSAVTVLATPASGSKFSIGTTPVQVLATDSWSNSAPCVFNVTVLGAQGVKSNVLAELVALRAGGTFAGSFAQKLEDAIQHLADSLNPACWVGETHLQPKAGNTAMNEEKLAAARLEEIMASNKSPTSPAMLQGMAERVARCDRLLAVISVNEAALGALTPKKIEQDQAMIAKGDREAESGHFANAIEHYRNAWRHALQLQLRATLASDGTARLQFVGNNRESYLVEMSTDLVTWTPLGTCTADANGNVEFTDANPANVPARFYRLVEQ